MTSASSYRREFEAGRLRGLAKIERQRTPELVQPHSEDIAWHTCPFCRGQYPTRGELATHIVTDCRAVAKAHPRDKYGNRLDVVFEDPL